MTLRNIGNQIIAYILIDFLIAHYSINIRLLYHRFSLSSPEMNGQSLFPDNLRRLNNDNYLT